MYDIVDGTWVDSQERDDDGDGTMYGQNAYEPNYEMIASPDFSADFAANRLHGYEWPLDATVSLSIDDLGTPETAGLHRHAADCRRHGEHTSVTFDLGGAFTLEPSLRVTMSDGTTIVSHLITDQSELSIGFIQTNFNEGWWRDNNTASFVDTAAQRGIALKTYDGQGQHSNQLWAFDQFVNDPDVNVIVLDAVEGGGWESLLTAAQAEGKVVVLQDRGIAPAPDTLYDTLVTLDFVEEGRKAGTEMCNLLAGSPARKWSSWLATLARGGHRPRGGLPRRSQMLVELRSPSRRPRTGPLMKVSRSMTNFLQTSSDIQGVYAHNDEMGLGAIQAIKDYNTTHDPDLIPGDDIKIVSIDASPSALAAVAAGELNATVECTPNLGPTAYDAAFDALNGITIPKTILVTGNVYRCQNLTTSVNPGGGGNVNVNVPPNCDGDKYITGTVVQLTATPAQAMFLQVGAGMRAERATRFR